MVAMGWRYVRMGFRRLRLKSAAVTTSAGDDAHCRSTRIALDSGTSIEEELGFKTLSVRAQTPDWRKLGVP